MRRFLVDVMCGKLATYLRMCGHDAAYALDRDATADEAVLAWARDEARTVITRDESLAVAAPSSIRLTARDVETQLEELHEAGVRLDLPDEPLRCSRCNGPLEAVDADAGEESLPEYVPSDHDGGLWRCVDCDQYYWKGSHWADVRERLATIG